MWAWGEPALPLLRVNRPPELVLELAGVICSRSWFGPSGAGRPTSATVHRRPNRGETQVMVLWCLTWPPASQAPKSCGTD